METKKTKTKKESIVIFEDWFRYARCLNDTEFRTFMSAILTYYKTQEQPNFEGLLAEVWNDIIEDLEDNVGKRQAKRDTMLRNAKSNPKLNINTNIRPDTRPDTRPDIGYNTILNTLSDPGGMEDGNMVDGIMEDEILNIEDVSMVDENINVDDDINEVDDENVLNVPNTELLPNQSITYYIRNKEHFNPSIHTPQYTGLIGIKSSQYKSLIQSSSNK